MKKSFLDVNYRNCSLIFFLRERLKEWVLYLFPALLVLIVLGIYQYSRFLYLYHDTSFSLIVFSSIFLICLPLIPISNLLLEFWNYRAPMRLLKRKGSNVEEILVDIPVVVEYNPTKIRFQNGAYLNKEQNDRLSADLVITHDSLFLFPWREAKIRRYLPPIIASFRNDVVTLGQQSTLLTLKGNRQNIKQVVIQYDLTGFLKDVEIANMGNQ